MVRPVSFKGSQKGFQIFLWELCVCIKYLSLGDPCCGTAGFLVAAMHHMLEKAGTDQNKRKNIKKKQLHGFELQSNMFAIAATNMILREDGNSNIKCEDFLKQNPAQVQLKGATVGMMNPPYSQGTPSSCKVDVSGTSSPFASGIPKRSKM